MNRPGKILTLFILLSSITISRLSAQPVWQIPTRGFVFESIILPSNSAMSECYIAYRVQYNRLVFVKQDNKFTSRFSVAIEAIDSLTGKIFRENQKKEVSVDNYELTNSPYLYFQGLIKLPLNPGKYKILPSVFDINSGSEHNFGQTLINVAPKEKDTIISPIVVKDDISIQGPDFVLSNYEGNIPFSRESYNLLIPVKDTSVTSLAVEIWNEDSLVIKETYSNSFISALELRSEENGIKIIRSDNGQTKTRNFIIRDFNKNLREGGVRIKFSHGKNMEKTTAFVKYVKWYNKPFALLNTEYAVKMLKYIASENEIDKISHYSDLKMYLALLDYWKKYDPTPQTAFNEIMEEYYQRVDYAINNFSIFTSRNGAETDRGKIYIKFGMPKEIQRTYEDSKNVKEVWHYDSPQRQFVFVDKSGLGNFVLNQSL